MIDERLEELAALHALDLLDGAERSEFESALARDPALQTFVRELRESAAALAHTAPAAEPPAELKTRLLTEIGTLPQQPVAPEDDKIIRHSSFVIRHFIPWAAAACFAATAAWLGQRYLASRSEAALLRDEQTIADLALQSAHNLLDAERILTQRQLADLTTQAADTNRELADTTARLTASDRLLAAARSQLETERSLTRQQLADLDQQLAAARTTSGATVRQLEEAKQQLSLRDAQLNEQAQRLAAITAQVRRDSDLAGFKIATLASMLKNSPQAVAVAVWNPARQEGVFTIEKMPALAANQDYQLWAIEDQPSAQPVSAGLVIVGPDGTGRVQFKTESPVGAVAKFALSREKKGGAPAHAGPQGQVIMISQ
jgi:anti-sigma-K factor RskA